MFRDEYGQVHLEEADVVQLLYHDPDLDLSGIAMINPEPYNRSVGQTHAGFDCIQQSIPYFSDVSEDSIQDIDQQKQSRWLMPEPYQTLDVWQYLANKISEHSQQELFDPERLDRMLKEMNMFEQRGLIPLLRYLIYLVETMRENRVLWGVGRGSSTASYVLYLIGVHRIDSFRYNLDIHEFLK